MVKTTLLLAVLAMRELSHTRVAELFSSPLHEALALVREMQLHSD